MATKLTLNINEDAIDQAKVYAKANNVSLSKLIENYLLSLTAKKKKQSGTSRLVESLTGIGKNIDEDYKKDYAEYLSKKYF